MDKEADYGVAAHWIYKENIKTKDGKQFKWIRQILDILDQSEAQRNSLNILSFKCTLIKYLYLPQE